MQKYIASPKLTGWQTYAIACLRDFSISVLANFVTNTGKRSENWSDLVLLR